MRFLPSIGALGAFSVGLAAAQSSYITTTFVPVVQAYYDAECGCTQESTTLSPLEETIIVTETDWITITQCSAEVTNCPNRPSSTSVPKPPPSTTTESLPPTASGGYSATPMPTTSTTPSAPPETPSVSTTYTTPSAPPVIPSVPTTYTTPSAPPETPSVPTTYTTPSAPPETPSVPTTYTTPSAPPETPSKPPACPPASTVTISVPVSGGYSAPLAITVTETATVYHPTTVTVTETTTATATESDYSTVVQHTIETRYISTTTTTTFTTSYPITTTTIVTCASAPATYPTYGRRDDSPKAPIGQALGRRQDIICGTTTVTQWTTTVKTAVETIYKPSLVLSTVVVHTTDYQTQTATVVVPTTDYQTQTATVVVPTTDYQTQTATVWRPTTYVETTTFTTSYPVTVVSDRTSVTTSIVTEIRTATQTVVSSYAVVETERVTQVNTVTAPGATVTRDGEDRTITLPGQATTIPGTTVVSTITEQLPAKTITITDAGQTYTSVVPGPTAIRETTITIGPSTVTVTPIFDVTLCPMPTGTFAPLDPKSDLTFGCKPGFVCNPPKPAGCNFWPEPPSKDFLCAPEDCIVAPPFTNVTWDKGQTGYYPPSYGYFDLNPEEFGLSYDIFEFEVYTAVEYGHTTTVTTGNWASQATLSEWPKVSATSTPLQPAEYAVQQRRSLHSFSKRDVIPATCFAECNGASRIGLSLGKSDELCADGSEFRNNVQRCEGCAKANDNIKTTPRDNIAPKFAQWLDFCDGRDTTPSSSSAPVPDAVRTSTSQDVEITTQAQANTGGFVSATSASTSKVDTTTSSPITSSVPPTIKELTTSSPSLSSTVISSATATVEDTSAPKTTVDSTSEGTSTAKSSLEIFTTLTVTDLPVETVEPTKTTKETSAETAAPVNSSATSESTRAGASATNIASSQASTASSAVAETTSGSVVVGGAATNSGDKGSPSTTTASIPVINETVVPVPSGTSLKPSSTSPAIVDSAARRVTANFTSLIAILSTLAILFV